MAQPNLLAAIEHSALGERVWRAATQIAALTGLKTQLVNVMKPCRPGVVGHGFCAAGRTQPRVGTR